MKTIPFLVPILLWICPAATCLAQDSIPDELIHQSILDLFPNDGIGEITIHTDLKALRKNRLTNDFQAATIQIDLGSDSILELPLKIRCRGRFRRQRCHFPPLKLKFKKNDLKEAGLRPLNELKMVTHCLDDSDRSRDLIAREYLCYRLFQKLDPNHLNVRLVRVRYMGGSRRMAKIRHYAILVEDVEDLADRLDAKPFDEMGIQPHQMDTSQCLRTSLFQYMIGNTDFSFELNRNLEMLQGIDSLVVAIPYDFDFSYIVSAPYAHADASLRQRDLSDRVFIGYPASMDMARPVIEEFLQLESEIQHFTASYTLMDKKAILKLQDFLNSFFDTLRNEQNIEAILKNPARQ
ncbi:MAG: hypothetical protein KatS3mg030_662 [Saprospiraceae bacterium]|nr:MAG: hypothetical protein KatS3mg030_662 [Saprospiraceae bacterium]